MGASGAFSWTQPSARCLLRLAVPLARHPGIARGRWPWGSGGPRSRCGPGRRRRWGSVRTGQSSHVPTPTPVSRPSDDSIIQIRAAKEKRKKRRKGFRSDSASTSLHIRTYPALLLQRLISGQSETDSLCLPAANRTRLASSLPLDPLSVRDLCDTGEVLCKLGNGSEASVLLCSCPMPLCSTLSYFLLAVGGRQSHNQNVQFAAAGRNERL